MKFTKEFLRQNRVAVLIGARLDIIPQIDNCAGTNHSYITLEKHYSQYGEDLAIDTNADCYCSGKYYSKNGWKVVTIEEFLETSTYEIY